MTNSFIRELISRIEGIKPSQVFVLVDSHTEQFCLPILAGFFKTKVDYKTLVMPAGEANKTIETAQNLWSQLANYGADRDSLLINLGGGVVTDMGGFVASTYKRGIRFFNIPTTLLAMVDAAIGGKTGVDYEGVKNMVGTFAQNSGLSIHADFLKTLPESELRSGFAEVIKHGLIADRHYWQRAQEAWQSKNMEEIISISKNTYH